jgi:hypothetical protein
MFSPTKIEIVIWDVEHVGCFISVFVFAGRRRVVCPFLFLYDEEQERNTWGAMTLSGGRAREGNGVGM